MMTKALNAIRKEREKQVAKGHSLASDQVKNQPGQLAMAAAAVAAHTGTLMRDPTAVAGTAAPTLWPFADGWNPGTPEDELVKAGALIVAELERRYADTK